MSSHHIVREKQEPALLVLGLDGFSDELLGQLLEWSPTVIVTSETAAKVHAMGIKIDWIINDSVPQELQSDVKLMPAGEDAFPVAALKYLITHNYPAVNVITDDFQLKDYLLFADKINLVIFNGNQKTYPINSGFSKWKPAGEIIKVLTHPHNIHIDGLEPNGQNSFITTHDGFFSIQFDVPYLFISEPVA